VLADVARLSYRRDHALVVHKFGGDGLKV
jgi:hypothetical protein